jgi:hypothetical protein
LGWKRHAIRCRDPKIRPTEGAILQESAPTLVPGAWALAGEMQIAASPNSVKAKSFLDMIDFPAWVDLELFSIS